MAEEDAEGEVVLDVAEFEMDSAPVAESGSLIYICSECGSNLTEIPNYNRYFCENCGLHY